MRKVLINIILCILIFYMLLPIMCVGVIYKAVVNKTVPVVALKSTH